MTAFRDLPSGRRVLVARVTGEAGERIQAWRRRHDPKHADRMPPHATLCYWAPVVDPALLEAQVRHAFARPVTVRLGGVRDVPSADHPFYLELLDTAELDEARRRLFDRSVLELQGRTEFRWHITCVRYGKDRDLEALREAALDLAINAEWTVDTVSYLQLRPGRCETVAEWRIAGAPIASPGVV
ncbi:MAG: 2'-5' RNA ligase family protein [Chloroflexi bacterium]|nr:2'-5' RNA ligase family protein [Chloroflexota bacterium]